MIGSCYNSALITQLTVAVFWCVVITEWFRRFRPASKKIEGIPSSFV